MAANGLESLTRAQTKTCIDRVFKRVANKSMFTMYALILHVGITDHSMMWVSVQVVGGGLDLSSPPLPARYRMGYNLLIQVLFDFDWSSVNDPVDTWSAFDSFFDIFQSAIDKVR